ncbi:unnamed protein product [Cylindrotheca closterium]|uniref:SAM-dependent MTase RsmB/NOP-type domain-containing protein n=1 Tax=Cylindrotheca closterium TaxID=2856 RepID=A0AAD2CV64_9STRA|nr:unnamed protein product [Cylindrotheca closterium]
MIETNNDMETTKGQKKRKRNKNPLSQARGKQNKHENVWFRRSNAGYSLFVQYYMNQPIGTISSAEGVKSGDATSSKEEGHKIGPKTGEGMQPKSGGGNSRAAKRRNKKKKGGKIQNTNSKTVDESALAVMTTDSSPTEVSSPPSLLESAYSKFEMLDDSPCHRNNVEFQSFLKAFSQPLPLSFRMRQFETASERRQMDNEVAEEVLAEFSDLVEAVQFGNTTLYRSKNRPSDVLCKENLSRISPDLKEFLQENSQNGVLARQEIGSMLPVVALHDVGAIRVGAKVLDVCASPGSKTLQALEIVGQNGRVVANDVSENRLITLRQALGRSGVSSSLLKRLHFSCQDGSRLQAPVTKSKSSGEKSKLKFDAVLCDVPCSGDGTCRKDKHILPMWKPNCGNDLHDLQLRILIRALQLVEVGGVVCYSTCTLNPIEDEAVVAAALSTIQASKDSKDGTKKKRPSPIVELLDWPSLPGDLVRRQGISSWKVAEFRADDQGDSSEGEIDIDDAEDIPKITWHDSYASATSQPPTCTISPTMWPPSNESSKDLHLEKCMRLWPQDRDTGGFFLALIKKNRDFKLK